MLAKAARGEYPAKRDRRSPGDVSPLLSSRSGATGTGHQGGEDVALADRVPPAQPDGAVAVQRPVRRDLLPQRDDLFRRADQVDAGRPLHAAAQAGRLALHRPFGIADRLASGSEAGGPHDLPEGSVIRRRSDRADATVVLADSAGVTGGRRFFDTAERRLDGEGFPGEYYVTSQADEVLVTVLGSCVSACIRDPSTGIGGMNHFMLAQAKPDGWGGDRQVDALRQLRDGKADQRTDQGGLCARAHGDQGVRRRQCDRHPQPDRHARTPISCCAIWRTKGLHCAAQDLRRANIRAAFNITRRPDGSCAGCWPAARRESIVREESEYAKPPDSTKARWRNRAFRKSGTDSDVTRCKEQPCSACADRRRLGASCGSC